MLLQRAGGQKSLIYSYAAHATTIGPEEMRLHGDYPAAVAALLGQDIEMVAYAAGAVGSMGPAKEAADKEAQLRAMADGLASAMALSLPALELHILQRAIVHRKPLDLGAPQWRIAQHIAIRPWLFHRLFGKVEHSLSLMQLGSNLWIGMPADYSGELSVVWPDERRPIFSSFNGSYAGYITDDRHYALDSYETRMMNWYGPGNGQYLQALSAIILDKLKP
jgi:hypothetical protein